MLAAEVDGGYLLTL